MKKKIKKTVSFKKTSSKKKTSTLEEKKVINKVWEAGETESLLRSLVDKEQEILQTEDALIESMRRFRDLFEQSPIGVGIHNAEGELLIVNKAYLDVFGLESFGKIKDESLFEDKKIPTKIREKINSGEVAECEAKHNYVRDLHSGLKEGEVDIHYTISPLVRDKDIIGYMVQVQDVTQRKKVEESQRLAQLGRLLSDMAHEVNNPLMIISGRSELALLDGACDDKLQDTLNIILDQCFVAKDIIQRLLKYSRIGKVEKTKVDLQGILDLIVKILNHHFKMSNVMLENNIKEGLPPVLANEKQLQEVFMNIMRNSADAMPDGGVITVNARKDKDLLKIVIEDTGEGMSKKVLDRIFEPFFTTKQKGTGLGMAVCHTIIQEHGGKLVYESEVGVGTTVTVILPIEK